MPINTANYRLARPTAQDRNLDAANLPFIRSATANGVRTVATNAGFQDMGNDLYQSPNDRSWVALSDQGRIERGVGNSLFQGLPSGQNAQQAQQQPAAPQRPRRNGNGQLPNFLQNGGGNGGAGAGPTRTQRLPRNANPTPATGNATPATPRQALDLRSMTLVTPDAQQHGNLACAQLPFMTADSASVRQAAQGAGFTQAGQDYWTHSDGSWVALVNQRIERGVNNTYFRGIPPPPPPPPVRAGNGYTQYTRLPSNTWTWYQQNIALGSLPIMTDAASARQTLRSRGFTQQGGGARERWTHPDGSYVDLTGGRIALGWQQWTLGQLPYNNRTSAP